MQGPGGGSHANTPIILPFEGQTEDWEARAWPWLIPSQLILPSVKEERGTEENKERPRKQGKQEKEGNGSPPGHCQEGEDLAWLLCAPL